MMAKTKAPKPAPVVMADTAATDDLREAAEPRLFDPGTTTHVLSLADRFLLPPFTMLDARSGLWQDRKRLWLGMGLRSEEGRSARMLAKSVSQEEWEVDPDTGERYPKGAPPGSVNAKILALTNGQSIFDPVLCEMAYRWFTPAGGRILDPFAGGSVRGIVASVLGRSYVGVDLSSDQVAANQRQDQDFVARGIYTESPVWLVGDSSEVIPAGGPHLEPGFDFVWSCPPYHDLEVYSKDPKDLSNMTWDGFRHTYGAIIEASIDLLAEDRFAGFVVGEIRGQDGFYRHFVPETIDAFERAGAAYYNEALLVSPAGTLPLRTAKQFVVSRKLGRCHQTVLLFCKGDPRRAAAAVADAVAEAAALRAMGRDLEDLEEADEDLTGMGH